MSFGCHRFDQYSNKNIFITSWGLPKSFLGLSGDLVSNIINKEAYSKLKKASRRPKGQKALQYFRLVETMTPKRNFEINWPLSREYDPLYCTHDVTHITKVPLLVLVITCLLKRLFAIWSTVLGIAQICRQVVFKN